jgi:hypothetical protein
LGLLSGLLFIVMNTWRVFNELYQDSGDVFELDDLLSIVISILTVFRLLYLRWLLGSHSFLLLCHLLQLLVFGV